MGGLLDSAELVETVMTPPEPFLATQAALRTRADHLRRDLAAAQATLGVYTLSELGLEPAELMQRAMRLIRPRGSLDWCGVVALRGECAHLVGAWNVSDAAPYARALQTSVPREGHDWL